LTVHSDCDFVRRCLSAGAFGYVVKSRVASELVLTVREAPAGSMFVSPPPGAPKTGVIPCSFGQTATISISPIDLSALVEVTVLSVSPAVLFDSGEVLREDNEGPYCCSVTSWCKLGVGALRPGYPFARQSRPKPRAGSIGDHGPSTCHRGSCSTVGEHTGATWAQDPKGTN
jgi:hypothetical protein